MKSWTADRERYGRLAWLLQPSYWTVAVFRLGQYSLVAPRPLKGAVHGISFLAYLVVRLVTGIDIPRTAKIGPGLLIHHFGGIIIHPQAVVGANCTMRHGVTIGARYDDSDQVPRVGSQVTIGSYAQILGGISVGDGATIGSMAVVLHDVPPGAVAVGNPARIHRKDAGRP